METIVWRSLKEIATNRDVTLVELLTNIASTEDQRNLSSAIRLFVLNFYRKQLELQHIQKVVQAVNLTAINMVGMGVTENAALKPNVKESAVGFSVTYVRAKTGRGAALHRHATEEVFIPVKGRWQVFWLEGDEERTVDLDEGDVLNVPIGIYRGFRSLTDALLMAIIGGPDAGKVDWHPSVLEEARKTGLTVDEEGNLIIEKPAA